MKVTAFIRKTAAKNNVTDQARVYFRVRDVEGIGIKAASELSINPNHWSAERQGYKPRVALVSEDKRMGFEKDIQNITHLIAEKYHHGVDGNWRKDLLWNTTTQISTSVAAIRQTSICYLTRYRSTWTRHPLPQKAGSITATI